MNSENIELDEDEISKELNRRLDEDRKKTALEDEVNKRFLVEKEKRKVHEATFEDTTEKKSRKRKVVEPEVITCATCGSTNMTKISNDSDVFVYEGREVTAVFYCNDCGRRSGVVE